jgi:hypothetical protein
VEWGARLRNSQVPIQVARRDCSEKPVPITTAWMLLQDQAGELTRPNAVFCDRWLKRSSGMQICVFCVCPAVKGARIAAHHTLAGTVFDWVREALGN